MPAIVVRCPACARPYSIDRRLLGRDGRCKTCGRTFRLIEDGAPAPPAASEDVPGADVPAPVSLIPASPTSSRARRPGPNDEVPEQFGRYRILRKLGEGGMGAVYLAHDEVLHRNVALKVPHFTARDGPEALARFVREARAAATLDHPNLCPVYDVGEVDGVHYLTMPYIEGKPLSESIDPGTPTPPHRAAAVVRTLALALQEAHDRGIVHRDLKPSNIMANRRRELVILDFGLARRFDQGDARLTETGALLGTPHYMAPEQVAGDPAAIGPACDIYSLGVILYELLAGRRPFDGPASLVMARALVAEPPKPSEHRPDLDPGLEAICLKAMAKKPEERYASMAEFGEVLGSFLGGTQGPLGPEPEVQACLDVAPSPATPANQGSGASPGTGDLLGPLAVSTGSLSDRPLKPKQTRSRPTIPVSIGVFAAACVGMTIWLVAIRRPASTSDAPSGVGAHATLARPSSLPASLTNSIGQRLVLIPAGECLIGSPDSDKEANPNETPQHRSRITQPFYLGVHEVTVGQFRQFVEATGYKTDAETGEVDAHGHDPGVGFSTNRRYHWKNTGFVQGDDHPVVNLTWGDAVAFCGWLSDKEGASYRLPTEAEWEYACRAGTATRFPSGDNQVSLRGIANVADAAWHETFSNSSRPEVVNSPTVPWSDGFPFTAPVGRFKPNDFGLFDMLGNVWEWCSDRYASDAYLPDRRDDPIGPERGDLRVARGGSFAPPNDEGGYRRAYVGSAGRRGIDSKTFITVSVGFRVARSLSPPRIGSQVVHDGTHSPTGSVRSEGPAGEVPVRPPTRRTQLVGGPGGRPFEAAPEHRGILVGMKVTLGHIDEKNPVISSIQPIYLTDRGREESGVIGSPGEAPVLMEADEGYAIGELVTRVGPFDPRGEIIYGCNAIFMKIRDDKTLDLAVAKESPWCGSSSQGVEKRLGGGGRPIVGLFGSSGANIDSLGLIQLGQPGEIRRTEEPKIPVNAAPAPDGWVSLFNGSDLAGWKTHPTQPAAWKVKDGSLTGPDSKSYLYSERDDYRDFHLRLEARIAEGGNSGVYVRAPFRPVMPEMDRMWPFGYEATIATPPLHTGALLRATKAGDEVLQDQPAFDTPAGRWFVLEIIVEGKHIVIKVNGTRTANHVHGQMTILAGHLVLQSATPTAPVEFRKIEIKELNVPAVRTVARSGDEPKVMPPASPPARPERRRASLTARRDDPEIHAAIRGGVRFLIRRQQPDGSWPDAVGDCPTGTTSLVALALLEAGESPNDSPAVKRALDFLQPFTADRLGRTYSVALQTMLFAATTPERDRFRIAANVAWLERAQIKKSDRVLWPGSWTYSGFPTHPGDNSNTQYALLALDAASGAGIPARQEVWASARRYWESSQRRDGSWAYLRAGLESGSTLGASTLSMTCAGISSLSLTDRWRGQSREAILPDGTVRECATYVIDVNVQRGLDSLASRFQVDRNYGSDNWKYYYLSGLERAGRLSGRTHFGANDWYAKGAEHLLHTPEFNRGEGSWTGPKATENNPLVATSFALMFLSRGGAPVVMTKLRHGPGGDWNNDPRDVANLVDVIARGRRRDLLWRVSDPATATVEELLRSPILVVNGHKPPEFDEPARKNLRAYVEGGGTLLAEACCGKPEFDRGFRALMKELFPGPESELHLLPPDHAVWTARHKLDPNVHPLWGIEYGNRTAVIYSPSDLSCYWSEATSSPDHPRVVLALRVGQNLVAYAVDLD